MQTKLNMKTVDNCLGYMNLGCGEGARGYTCVHIHSCIALCTGMYCAYRAYMATIIYYVFCNCVVGVQGSLAEILKLICWKYRLL